MSAGCLVAAMHPSKQSSSYCLLEAGHGGVMPPRRIQRKRPPEFGATIPTLTRGRERLATNRNAGTTNDNTSTTLAAEDDNRNNCPMCKKFSAGPCGNIFQRWLACTDCYTGKVDPGTGQPLHLSQCADLAVELAECLEENTVYYSKDEKHEEEIDVGRQQKQHQQQQLTDSSELKDAWTVFVTDMEDCIRSKKYTVQPFTATLNPKIKIRANTTTNTGAAFFVMSSSENNDNDEQQPQQQQPLSLVAAYILDNNSNVIAAGSQEDMYMNDELGCVLQFKISDGMKSVTVRAIYDTTAGSNDDDDDGILIYSRTMLVPVINE
jgi:hypothetical protein